MAQTFNLTPLNVVEVHEALKKLDPDKSAGLDKLEPYFEFSCRLLQNL